MRLSIRSIFMILFGMAITSLLTLSIFALYFNAQLIKNQNLLIEASRIGIARYAMISSISQFFARQEMILSSSSLKEISSVRSRNPIEKKFKNGMDALAKLSKSYSDLDKVIQAVTPTYQAFLQADQQLLDLTSTRLKLKNKLDDEVMVIVNKIASIINSTEEINGIILLIDMKSKNILRRELLSTEWKSDTEREQLKSRLTNYLDNSGNDDSSEMLKAQFGELAYLVQEIVETTNPDSFTDLQINQIARVLNSIQENLKSLTTTLKGDPALSKLTQELNTQFDTINSRITIATPNNFILLRSELNNTEKQLQQTIRLIDANQTNLIKQFDALVMVSEHVSTNLKLYAQKIATNNRSMIAGIMFTFLLLMAVLGYFLLREMTRLFINLETLNAKLLATARQAGMAEIAASVLHNIGNVLNSINVSVGLLKENLDKSGFKKLVATSELIETHQSDFSNYIASDEKGKYIPQYLVGLIKLLNEERNRELSEINRINLNIKLIEDIVIMQQSISGIKIQLENIYLPDLINMSVQVCANFIRMHGITLKLDYKVRPHLSTDKSKAIQILVNLIRNAIDALQASDKRNKTISITIQNHPQEQAIEIIVQDNGSGITAENLTKIFNFGFTTKIEGHGFGLHSSILAAKELGGELSVSSEGLDKGSKFILKLPLIITILETHNDIPH